MADHDIAAYELFESGMSYAEIAEELSISEKQVNHSLARIRAGQEERRPKIEKSNDAYIITSGARVISVSEAKLRLLKEYYCGAKLTINQVCRKLDLPRRNFNLIKTAFNITKDDPPFIDEDFFKNDVEDLVDVTLEKQQDRYFIRLGEKEIDSLKKELNKYRQQDFFIDKLHDIVTESMNEFASNYTGPELIEREVNGSETMLEIDLIDAHIGKLAWHGEVGSSYDYKIARRRFLDVVQDVYERAQSRNITKILFIVGSDLFTFDTIFTTTTKGTPQDSDLRWQKLFAVVVQMLIESIDLLSTVAPVEVLLVPGNHDKMTSFYCLQYLSAWYRDRENVKVNEDTKTRKYIEFGKNLIGFSHGDLEGKRLASLMPIEQPTAWGRTRYREMHVGHLHHETVEGDGVIIRRLSSITGTDAWHFERGFVGSVTKCQSFLWDFKRGLRDIWHTNID